MPRPEARRRFRWLAKYSKNCLKIYNMQDLYYLVREPKIKADKSPLLPLLHGYGSNEQDLFSFASELPEEYYVVSARAPYDMAYGSYAWYAINFDADENKFSDIGQAQASRDIIIDFIEELLVSYAID